MQKQAHTHINTQSHSYYHPHLQIQTLKFTHKHTSKYGNTQDIHKQTNLHTHTLWYKLKNTKKHQKHKQTLKTLHTKHTNLHTHTDTLKQYTHIHSQWNTHKHRIKNQITQLSNQKQNT